MGMPAQRRRFTIAEYLELEEDAVDRHEYQDGEILAMAGGSPEQSFITANFVREAGNALKGKPCRVAESNLRIRIPQTPRYMYPDASIICGPLQFDPQDPKRHTILNPKVIIEVLSPSTEAYDRGDKFTQYRQIPAFEEYILISQVRPSVESFLRQADGAWSILNFTGLDAAAKVRSLGISIPMAELYAGIEWPSSASASAAD
ncbi:MAG TPA: Uma2 family endonuclease [Tepidisphaeraceae bacterium]|jgi:Uma2 family endonuclease|nr:Uma2 family endonuclease [Tepidisphaeraceae bacterium]